MTPILNKTEQAIADKILDALTTRNADEDNREYDELVIASMIGTADPVAVLQAVAATRGTSADQVKTDLDELLKQGTFMEDPEEEDFLS